jgi:F-type H+-transporting ATPase subunit b
MQEILNILGSVGFNWHVALANFVNFLIILFLLNKFFFGKIGKTLSVRHDIIERGLKEAKEAEKALAEADEEKKSILKAAHKERDSIVAQGETLAHDIVANLQKEAEEKIALRNHKLDEDEKNLAASVEKAFREKAPSIVTKLYATTLMKELTEEENNKLVASMKV